MRFPNRSSRIVCVSLAVAVFAVHRADGTLLRAQVKEGAEAQADKTAKPDGADVKAEGAAPKPGIPKAFSIVKVERVEEPGTEGPERQPRTRRRPAPSASLLDVMAGDDLRVTVDTPLPLEARYEARLGSSGTVTAGTQPPTALARLDDEDTTVLLTKAPPVEGWLVRELRIKIAEGPESTNGFPLRVAPAANALIESLSPTVVEVGTPVKVTGEGFFAPREQITMKIGEITVYADRVSPAGDWFSAIVPETEIRTSRATGPGARTDTENYDAGVRNVSVTVWGVPAQIPEELLNDNLPLTLTLWRQPGAQMELRIAAIALATAIGVLLILWGLYRTLERRRGLIQALLYEPQSQTYSLSRAQFFWWTIIITYGYLFLFFGHGLHQGNWSFPPLEGFAYTFLISLGTLLIAQGTSSVRGSKGAGVVHPSPADLIVHGGVLAPERVQQVVWTLLAGLGFLWIVIKTYATSTGLPQIPNEMLALMGISSAGYIGGKLARKPGPIIQRVEFSSGSVVLNIFGQHLSISPRVLIDNVELPRDNVEQLEPDPSHKDEFAKALKIKVPDTIAANESEWFSRSRLVVVVNEDTQRAEWELTIPTVTKIEVSDPDATGKRTITAIGDNIGAGSTLVVPGVDREIPLTPEAGSSTRYKAEATQWPAQSPVDVVLKNAQSARTTYTWTKEGTQTQTTTDSAAADAQRRESDEKAEDTGTSKKDE